MLCCSQIKSDTSYYAVYMAVINLFSFVKRLRTPPRSNNNNVLLQKGTKNKMFNSYIIIFQTFNALT
jgi:hypothetical protein